MPCPSADQILDHCAGRLDGTQRLEVEAHVDQCGACRALLVEIAFVDIEEEAPPSSSTTSPEVWDASFDRDRYDLGTVIGRGGMGEVRLAHDTRIDRQVAVKSMRPGLSGESVRRFVREARVQGGLDHPAVVPIHDLGIDGDGKPYLVMKRLVGTTLRDLLQQSGSSITPQLRNQLLAKLVDVCLAVEFAHTRGIIHRDLKPSNIMLGDFGEVYVLDWGLAKLVRDDSASLEADVAAESSVDGPLETRSGTQLGTPGYMAPEQVRGDEIDERADVFSLGCLLFEVLTGVGPLPRQGDWREAALATACHRPSERAVEVDVPLELDDLCAQATAADRADRPTARQLADGIQAFLDGDRDLVRRRKLAADHAVHAVEASQVVGDDARAEAMREAGRALALDPENEVAQRVLGHLLLDSGGTPPAAAIAQADCQRARTRQKVMRWAAVAYFALAAGFAGLFALPVRNPWLLILLMLVNGALGIAAAFLGHRELPLRTRWYFVFLSLHIGSLGVGCVLFGPLLVLPFFVLSSLAVWLTLSTGYPAWMTVLGHAVAFVPALVLEGIGVLPATFYFDGRGLVLVPWAVELPRAWAAVILAVAYFVQCVNTVVIIVSSRRTREREEDRLHALLWHLQKLIPARAARPVVREE